MITIDECKTCSAGSKQVIVRLTIADRDTIHAAAKQLGMSAAGFIRNVACQAASQVLLDQPGVHDLMRRLRGEG